MKEFTWFAVLTMALLFIIYSQLKMEFNLPGVVYLNEVLLLFSIVLALWVYQIQKKNERNDFAEHLSTVVKVSVFSFLLYIPLNFVASFRLNGDPINSLLNKIPRIVGEIFINGFYYVPIIILSTILSYAIYWFKYKRSKG